MKYGNDNISFWRKSNKEIDLLVTKNTKQIAIEVKFSDNINLKELKTLTDYMKLKKVECGIVITKNEIDKKEVNNKTIYFIPYYLILMLI